MAGQTSGFYLSSAQRRREIVISISGASYDAYVICMGRNVSERGLFCWSLLYSLTSLFAHPYTCNTCMFARLFSPRTLLVHTLSLQSLYYCTPFGSTEAVQRDSSDCN